MKKCMRTGAREVARDLHSPLWKTGMCWSHFLGQNIFVGIWPEYLSTRILSLSVNFVCRAGHIAKAYGVMREGSGYRCDSICHKTNIILFVVIIS